MLLAVDIGNTNVVFGLYDGDTLAHTFRVSTVHTRTEDEYAVLIRELLALRGLRSDVVDAAIIASVVPPLTDVVADAVRRGCAREPLLIGPGVKTGIPVLYENPREVGADRIVNAVAAYDRVHGPVIVVDFGTATTFDCISPKGEYLGGVIVPGVRVSLDALQSGLIFGHAAMVDGMIERLEEEQGYKSEVIATGGLGGLIAKHARRIDSVDENLTLDGLRILYARHREPAGERKGGKKAREPELT